MSWREKLHEFIEARSPSTDPGRMAAERATERKSKRSGARINLLRVEIDARKAIQADLDFHMSIATRQPQQRIARFLEELRQPVRTGWSKSLALRGYDRVYEQHDVVFNAILNRDSVRAQR